MTDRSNRPQDSSTKSGTERGGDTDAGRPADDASGERGYRGRSAPDTPPGSVPGGSYGAGGGYGQGDLSGADTAAEGDEREAGTAEHERREASSSGASDVAAAGEDEDFWRDARGSYGFSRRDEPGDGGPASGYGAQGFGAGEDHASQWGGGMRGGYGGGMPGRDSAAPGDPRNQRGTSWGERGQPRRGTS